MVFLLFQSSDTDNRLFSSARIGLRQIFIYGICNNGSLFLYIGRKIFSCILCLKHNPVRAPVSKGSGSVISEGGRIISLRRNHLHAKSRLRHAAKESSIRFKRNKYGIPVFLKVPAHSGYPLYSLKEAASCSLPCLKQCYFRMEVINTFISGCHQYPCFYPLTNEFIRQY